MTKCCDLLVCRVIAAAAGLVCIPALLCTCCCLRFMIFKIVPKRLQSLCFTAELGFANRAINYIVVAAIFSTCRFDSVFFYCLSRCMTKCCDLLVSRVVAATAGLVCIPALLCTCCCLRFMVNKIMPKCFYSLRFTAEFGFAY